MGRQPTYPVVIVSHVDTDEDDVVLWGYESGLKQVESCLANGERIEVRRTRMTEAKFMALEEYEGEC